MYFLLCQLRRPEGNKSTQARNTHTPRFWFLISFHNNRNQDSEEMDDSRTGAINIQDEGRVCCSAKK